MNNKFKEGQDDIKTLWYPDETIVKIGDRIDKITVSIEYGQMAGVPWFCLWKDGTMVSKVNAIYVVCVDFI